MKRIATLIAIALLAIGCTNSNDRLVEMAKQHEAQQAEQNLKMADLQKQVAEGSKLLVVAQDNLRSDQAGIGQQRDNLERERREIAGQRNRDAAIEQLGIVAAGLLPLILVGYLIYSMKRSAGPDEAIVTELLVSELASPRLFGPSSTLSRISKAESIDAPPK